MSSPGPVLIATCCRDDGRFSAFREYASELIRPRGSKFRNFASPSIANSRNVACEATLAGYDGMEAPFEWLLFLDDDHAFGPDLLIRLLSHGKDIVSGTYLNRRWPFHVCAFWKWEEDSGKAYKPAFPVALRKGVKGLHPIVCAGCGALLIHRRVLEAIPKPWFTLEYNNPDQIAEDFTFFRRVELVGLTPWIDLDTIVGHMNTVAFWPYREGDDWMTVLASGGERIPLPSAVEMLRIKQAEDAEFGNDEPRIILP